MDSGIGFWKYNPIPEPHNVCTFRLWGLMYNRALPGLMKLFPDSLTGVLLHVVDRAYKDSLFLFVDFVDN